MTHSDELKWVRACAGKALPRLYLITLSHHKAMEKIIEVLGLGSSLSTYKPSGNQTIGVNDIFKHHPVDYLVVMDRMQNFTPERKEIIQNSTPKIFFTWSDWDHPNIVRVERGAILGCLDTLDSGPVPNSTNSTFAATIIAYRLGATTIILHGADFNTHPVLSKKATLYYTHVEFQSLFVTLRAKGVSLYVSSAESSLSAFIPVYSPK